MNTKTSSWRAGTLARNRTRFSQYRSLPPSWTPAWCASRPTRMTGPPAALDRAVAAYHGGNGLEQNLHIEQHRPFAHIHCVERNDFLEVGDVRAAAHLPQARDARFRTQTGEVVDLILHEIAFWERPRSDERHLPVEHIPQLRQLVHTPAPHPSPHAGNTGLIRDFEKPGVAAVVQMRDERLHLFRAVHHRAELEHPERTAAGADAAMPEDGRAR